MMNRLWYFSKRNVVVVVQPHFLLGFLKGFRVIVSVLKRRYDAFLVSGYLRIEWLDLRFGFVRECMTQLGDGR
jgi:hypothetical protein